MVLRLRLARFGTKRKPVYNIVVAQARSARDSLPLEVLGTYNPKPIIPRDTSSFSPSSLSSTSSSTAATPSKQTPFKSVTLDTVRTKYWIGVGAQPTEPVWRILGLAGILPPSKKIAGIAAATATGAGGASTSTSKPAAAAK